MASPVTSSDVLIAERRRRVRNYTKTTDAVHTDAELDDILESGDQNAHSLLQTGGTAPSDTYPLATFILVSNLSAAILIHLEIGEEENMRAITELRKVRDDTVATYNDKHESQSAPSVRVAGGIGRTAAGQGGGTFA